MSHPHYRDTVAIITGGASGIGAALAKHLGQLGARVVVADRQIELAKSVAQEIYLAGGSAVASPLDVREPSAISTPYGNLDQRGHRLRRALGRGRLLLQHQQSGHIINTAVSVLCPGAIHTPILPGGKFGRMGMNAAAQAELAKIWEMLRPMPGR